MFGTIARALAVVVLVGLLGTIGVGIYQAGFVAGAASEGATVVAPLAGYGAYGPGWGLGFGVFGFFGTILFVLILFGVLRATFWRGPRAWGGGWGHGGPRSAWHGPEALRGTPWESRAREIHEAWHRADSQPSAGSGSDRQDDPSKVR